MATYDNDPGFTIDTAVAEAYQADIEAITGTLSGYRTALELGCGSAVFTEFLSSHVPTVIGVDNSGNQLTEARQRLPNTRFIQADIASPQFVRDMVESDHTFDLIATRYVVHELADPIETFLLWKPLLNPSGKVLLIENTWIRQDWGEGDWGQRTDHLPLACTQTWATAAYCLQKAGFRVNACSWMEHTNQLAASRLLDGFRLYLILAEVSQVTE
ncbi:MAG: methyltransferase domain-containing protein [Chloroflexota bacterium]